MKTACVTVVPYDVNWKADFEKIKNEIVLAIGDLIIGVEHVGSTSVEGLCAKPCIDIDVVIKDMSVFDSVVKGLAAIGYVHEGDLGIKGREAFDYKDKPHLKKHHLYVCPQYSEELHRHVAFRELLRSDHDAAERYGKVKQEAAKLFPCDIEKYINHKSQCIKELYERCGLKKD